MKLRVIFLMIALAPSAAMVACSDNKEFQWYDTTGSGRSSEIAMQDKSACDKLYPQPPIDSNNLASSSVAEQNWGHQHEACMEKRGWKLR